MFTDPRASRRVPMLAAVGELQFDVARFRLQNEYDTATEMERLPYKLARWLDDEPENLSGLWLPSSARLVRDQLGHPAVLFQSAWDAEYAQRENPAITFSPVSRPGASGR